MQYLTEWRNPMTGGFVILSLRVLRTFRRFRQSRSRSTEAGGVILGYRKGSHLEVCAVTPPQKADQRSRYAFSREERGHQRYATLLWHRSQQRIDYLGDWHTHPEPKPTPSPLDLREWKAITSRRPGTLTLMIIVGTRGLSVFGMHDSVIVKLEPLYPAFSRSSSELGRLRLPTYLIVAGKNQWRD
jgi:integrative and conjugative element protein (TIGR02256 family)